jgi:hypothetical protein
MVIWFVILYQIVTQTWPIKVQYIVKPMLHYFKEKLANSDVITYC